jgi:virginiamycin B lyase
LGAAFVCFMGGALIAGLATGPPASAAPGVNGLFDVSGVGASNQIVLGPDGNMWVTLESATADLARITPAGAVTEFDPVDVTDPVGIAVGPDGKLWVTQAQSVARFDPADPAAAQKFTVADISDPRGITAGPGGALWTASADKVIKIPAADPANPVTFPATGVAGARAIAAGEDGNLWVADFGGNQIVRVTPAGVGTKYPTGGGPQGVAAAQGRQQVAYGDPGTNPQTVGRIDSGGNPLATQVPMTDPFGVAFGPDGAYWVALFLTDSLGRLTPAGAYSTVTGLPPGSGPRQVAAGAANTVWVTLDTAEKVARFAGVLPPAPSATPTTPPTGGPKPADPTLPTGGPKRPDPGTESVRVKATAVQRRGVLKVRIRPDLGPKKQWTFRVQRKAVSPKKAAGRKNTACWRTLPGRYLTAGNRHARLVDLGPGRYRAKALPRFGYRGAVSAAVRLRR